MNSIKSAGAIAIAPSCSQSFSIPNTWERPKFAIGDRVEYLDRHCLMSCTVRGMEFLPDDLPEYLGGKAPTGGWYYYLLPDNNPTIHCHILDDAFSQAVDETEITPI